MKEFFDNWQKDSKYRAKIKLTLYLIFVILVTIYVSSISRNIKEDDNNAESIPTTSNSIIELKDNYSLSINVSVDNIITKYSIVVNGENQEITKEKNNEISEYKYENAKYYKRLNNNYVETTSKEIYDTLDSSYLNIDSINLYLSKGTKDSNQYTIYIKDLILDYKEDDYFVILVNDQAIDIDYTPLIKAIDNEDKIVKVSIEIKE